MKKLSQINENIFDGIGRRSKGDSVRKENYVEQVDLGFPSGTIWATCNLGASSPEEYGNYYAWGETESNGNYSWYNYKFGKEDNLVKYNKEDGKIILDPEDDVAHVVLGGKWHIPTKEQIKELFDNTTNEDSEFNGVKGRLFKSKINGNILFFPYSGSQSNSSPNGFGYSAHYWTSSLSENSHNFSMEVFFNHYDYRLVRADRCYGLCVRGVLNKK